MNFNEFVNEVKDNIKLFLPKDYENAEVSTMECQKLNRAYTGLMVRKEGEMLTPTINLSAYSFHCYARLCFICFIQLIKIDRRGKHLTFFSHHLSRIGTVQFLTLHR